MQRRLLRILTWNVGRPSPERAQAQVSALVALQPDIIALQEVSVSGVRVLRAAFAADAWEFHVATTLAPRGSYGQLIAARWPISRVRCSETLALSFPRLTANIDSPWGDLEITNVHVPHIGRERGKAGVAAKIEVFDRLHQEFACHVGYARVLCGDFNSPAVEQPHVPHFIGHGDLRQQAAEESVLVGLAEFCLHDVFRLVNGYSDTSTVSWFGNGHGRYDHILAPKSLGPKKCNYILQLTGPRGMPRLSDHAALVATFRP